MKPSAVRIAAWLPLVAASAAGAYWIRQLPPAQLMPQVAETDGALVRITWNRDSAPALLGHSAVVDIQDGADSFQVALSPDQLRDGSVTYRRRTAKLWVRMRVDEGSDWVSLRPDTEVAWFRTADAPAEPAVLPAAVATAAPVEALEKLASPLPPAQVADREETPRRMAVIPAGLPVSPPSEEPAMPAAPAVSNFRPIATAPLELDSLAVAPPHILPPAPHQPSYKGPRSGRIIWTGEMGRRGVVEIESSKASIGSMSGGLPGVPVSIRISPAEFAPQGLVVYTPDAASNGRTENASAGNGWNATLFHWDPERARELVVLESPNPSNDFKRLAVRNDSRSCPVMLVEWSVR